MDGGAREQQEIDSIKAAVKRNTARNQQQGNRGAKTIVGPKASVTRNPTDSVSNASSLSPNVCNSSRAGTSALGLHESRASYRESELLMHYFDHVFPLQFACHVPDQNRGGRGWLLWLLTRTPPLMQAALSLSALHQYSTTSAVSNVIADGDEDKQHKELITYHSSALEELRTFLESFSTASDRSSIEQLEQRIALLACGTSLISFEVFSGATNDWAPHLQALASVVKHLEAERELLSLQWQPYALQFLIGVVVWFTTLACVTTNSRPLLQVTEVLTTHSIDIADIMGCQNWVMEAIADISQLRELTLSATDQWRCNQDEMSADAQSIRERLLRGLTSLENMKEAAACELDLTTPTAKYARSYHTSQPGVTTGLRLSVTKVFALAALVQLHAVALGPHPGISEIRKGVADTIRALEALPPGVSGRVLVWPICIAGCMAEPYQYSFFEKQLTKELKGTDRNFGNSASALRVVRKCWEQRAEDLTTKETYDWNTAMQELGEYVLLV